MPVDGALNAPGLIAEVRKTLSAQAIGDDQPRPYTSTLHFTLSFVDHDTGSLPSLRMPAPDGPRNWGQATEGSELCTKAAESTESAETNAASLSGRIEAT
jgi:hypothetical protein